MRPDGEVDLLAGTLQLIGDLHPKTGADDHHRAVGEFLRIVVVARMDLGDRRGLGDERGMIGFWNAPVADTMNRASIVPSEVSTWNPGLPSFLRTLVTSTPVRIGAPTFSAHGRGGSRRPPPYRRTHRDRR